MPSSISEAFEHDVAVSFLSRDLPYALALKEAIGPSLNVFVYTRNQEELAATMGVESLTSTFRDNARISVVLFRAGWGASPWTGVEELAIQARCLKTRFRSLVLVNLDGSQIPEWVPDGYFHFDAQNYPPQELAGVVKARAQELGATIRKISLAERASAIESRRQFDAETSRMLGGGTTEWITERGRLFEAIRKELMAVARATGWPCDSGPGALIGGFVVIAKNQSLQIKDMELYANTAQRAYLEVRYYDKQLAVQKPGVGYFAFEPFDAVAADKLKLRRTPEMGWCWEIGGKIHSTEAVAEIIIGKLIGRVGADDRHG